MLCTVLVFTLIAGLMGVPAAEPGGFAQTGAGLDITGALSAIRQPRNVVVRDQKAWESLWKEHSPATAAPSVDFKREDVIGIFAGQKPTGGYSVKIDRVAAHGKAATVEATVLRPPRGGMTIQMITYPFAMRAVRKLPRTVQFILRESQRK